MLSSQVANNGSVCLTEGSYIASIAVGKTCLNSTQTSLGNIVQSSPLGGSILLNVPAYTFNPVFETSHLSSPVKKIVYSDQVKPLTILLQMVLRISKAYCVFLSTKRQQTAVSHLFNLLLILLVRELPVLFAYLLNSISKSAVKTQSIIQSVIRTSNSSINYKVVRRLMVI